MADLNYRYYEPGDEAHIVPLWNRTLISDPITAKRFRNLVLLDANFDPQGMRLAFEGTDLVGCVYAVRRRLPMHGTDVEPENGWIPFFFTAASHRRQGIGSRLLHDAFGFLRKQGRQTVFFASYAPNYIVPGIDAKAYPEGRAFLQRHGFVRQARAVAMDIPLAGFEIPAEVQDLKRQRLAEGYSFELAQDRDLVELIGFATRVFNPDWGRAIREGILQGLPLSQIIVAREQERLVGFCMHGGYEGIRERFGPFGVDPAQQGRGLGKILLYDVLFGMRAIGLHGAWFLWTGETTPAGVLYARSGFAITRKFDVMRRSIANPQFNIE